MQPENGGVSVFAHEYAHDLGLPDDYDTSGASNNNNEYWTLMAQRRLNGAGEPIGPHPPGRTKKKHGVWAVGGAAPPHRRGRADRHPPRRSRRMEQAAARLAEL